MQPHPLNPPIANEVLDWIKAQPFYQGAQALNYAVGLTRGSKLIISKVGGVTSATAAMAGLDTMLRSKPWWTSLEGVYLGKKFGGDGNSNHGEMCVLAAADAMEDPLIWMKCTGDNCPACYAMLADAGVHSMNDSATGSQSGWIHPRGPMALGSQLNNDWKGQIAELKSYNALQPAARAGFGFRLTQKLTTVPAGAYEMLS